MWTVYIEPVVRELRGQYTIKMSIPLLSVDFWVSSAGNLRQLIWIS